MPQLGTICITNQAPNKAIIDIEGIIGIPEWWQFDDPQDRIATFDKLKKSAMKSVISKPLKSPLIFDRSAAM